MVLMGNAAFDGSPGDMAMDAPEAGIAMAASFRAPMAQRGSMRMKSAAAPEAPAVMQSGAMPEIVTLSAVSAADMADGSEGTGGGAGGGGGSAPAVSIRSDFQYTVFASSIYTAELPYNGDKAQIQMRFTLPDSVGTFELKAFAIAYDPVAQQDLLGVPMPKRSAVRPRTFIGDTSTDIIVRRSITLKPALPRFARFGDVFEGGVTIRRSSVGVEAAQRMVRVRVRVVRACGPDSAVCDAASAVPGLSVLSLGDSEVERTMLVPSGSEDRVVWMFHADPSLVGSAVIQFEAAEQRDGEWVDQDAAEWELRVLAGAEALSVGTAVGIAGKGPAYDKSSPGDAVRWDEGVVFPAAMLNSGQLVLDVSVGHAAAIVAGAVGRVGLAWVGDEYDLTDQQRVVVNEYGLCKVHASGDSVLRALQASSGISLSPLFAAQVSDRQALDGLISAGIKVPIARWMQWMRVSPTPIDTTYRSAASYLNILASMPALIMDWPQARRRLQAAALDSTAADATVLSRADRSTVAALLALWGAHSDLMTTFHDQRLGLRPYLPQPADAKPAAAFMFRVLLQHRRFQALMQAVSWYGDGAPSRDGETPTWASFSGVEQRQWSDISQQWWSISREEIRRQITDAYERCRRSEWRGTRTQCVPWLDGPTHAQMRLLHGTDTAVFDSPSPAAQATQLSKLDPMVGDVTSAGTFMMVHLMGGLLETSVTQWASTARARYQTLSANTRQLVDQAAKVLVGGMRVQGRTAYIAGWQGAQYPADLNTQASALVALALYPGTATRPGQLLEKLAAFVSSRSGGYMWGGDGVWVNAVDALFMYDAIRGSHEASLEVMAVVNGDQSVPGSTLLSAFLSTSPHPRLEGGVSTSTSTTIAWRDLPFRQPTADTSTTPVVLASPNAASAQPTADSIQFFVRGRGEVTVTLQLLFTPSILPRHPRYRGLFMQRVIQRRDPVTGQGIGPHLKGVEAGAVVVVSLQVTTPDTLYGARIYDLVPAGLEPMNPDLSGEDVLSALPFSMGRYEHVCRQRHYMNRCPWWIACWLNIPKPEVRPEKVEWNSRYLHAGSSVWSYQATAVTSGVFLHAPAVASAHNQPELLGTSAGSYFAVFDTPVSPSDMQGQLVEQGYSFVEQKFQDKVVGVGQEGEVKRCEECPDGTLHTQT